MWYVQSCSDFESQLSLAFEPALRRFLPSVGGSSPIVTIFPLLILTFSPATFLLLNSATSTLLSSLCLGDKSGEMYSLLVGFLCLNPTCAFMRSPLVFRDFTEIFLRRRFY